MGRKAEFTLNDELLNRIKGNYAEVDGMKMRPVPCLYCCHKTIIMFADTTGHFQAKCPKCNQTAVYRAVDYRKVKPSLRYK